MDLSAMRFKQISELLVQGKVIGLKFVQISKSSKKNNPAGTCGCGGWCGTRAAGSAYGPSCAGPTVAGLVCFVRF